VIKKAGETGKKGAKSIKPKAKKARPRRNHPPIDEKHHKKYAARQRYMPPQTAPTISMAAISEGPHSLFALS
jgi:hypothetical protein